MVRRDSLYTLPKNAVRDAEAGHSVAVAVGMDVDGNLYCPPIAAEEPGADSSPPARQLHKWDERLLSSLLAATPYAR